MTDIVVGKEIAEALNRGEDPTGRTASQYDQVHRLKRQVTSYALGQALEAAGVIPPRCRSVVIRLGVAGAVEIEVECFGTTELLAVDWSVVSTRKLNGQTT